MQWYPLKLTYHVRDYAFGERLIPEMLGKEGTPSGRVSETWEISDERNTRATIVNGSLAGEPFHDVFLANQGEIVKPGWQSPHFPLLAKFLDASHMLPVHLHADDQTARRIYGEPHGKSEAWHILWAAPGATIMAGVKPGVSDDDLRAAFRAQDYASVMPSHPISAGDTVYVPGGILHSFGPDTLIFEIQQTSDLTQTVMPNDLYGNPQSEEQWNANIEQTLVELKRDFLPKPTPGLPMQMNDSTFRRCAAGPHFALERWILRSPFRFVFPWAGGYTLSNIAEPVTMTWPGGEEVLGRAESCVVPAALEELTITPTGSAELIACFPPDLQEDVIAPLREAGFSDEEIGKLGEVF